MATQVFAWLGVAIVLSSSGCAAGHGAHAVADDWQPVITHPEFAPDQGPVVLVDAAHGNWHTIDGRFTAFAELLRQDGYRVRSAETELSSALLEAADIFVIVNAVKGGEDSEWKLPTPLAFKDAEIELLERWVGGGGALLLIADHMPFPGSVANLADAFGVVFTNGYAKRSASESGTLKFTRAAGTLFAHPVTGGRNELEVVTSVKTYTGQAFRFAVPGDTLMRMPDDWVVLLPQDAFAGFDATTPAIPARGLIQGGVLRHGAGRVAVFGEAAMFTAQAVQRDSGEVVRLGLSDPDAADNAQFVLNVMHWLSALLEE